LTTVLRVSGYGKKRSKRLTISNAAALPAASYKAASDPAPLYLLWWYSPTEKAPASARRLWEWI
jgi:hypothetical protein